MLYKYSPKSKKSVFVDESIWPELKAWLLKEQKNLNKFNLIVEQLLDKYSKPSPSLYGPENYKSSISGVTAMKPFKGRENPRIYCKTSTTNKSKLSSDPVHLVIAAHFLEKKKNEKLTNKEKSIIDKVNVYSYTTLDTSTQLYTTLP